MKISFQQMMKALCVQKINPFQANIYTRKTFSCFIFKSYYHTLLEVTRDGTTDPFSPIMYTWYSEGLVSNLLPYL